MIKIVAARIWWRRPTIVVGTCSEPTFTLAHVISPIHGQSKLKVPLVSMQTAGFESSSENIAPLRVGSDISCRLSLQAQP